MWFLPLLPWKNPRQLESSFSHHVVYETPGNLMQHDDFVLHPDANETPWKHMQPDAIWFLHSPVTSLGPQVTPCNMMVSLFIMTSIRPQENPGIRTVSFFVMTPIRPQEIPWNPKQHDDFFPLKWRHWNLRRPRHQVFSSTCCLWDPRKPHEIWWWLLSPYCLWDPRNPMQQDVFSFISEAPQKPMQAYYVVYWRMHKYMCPNSWINPWEHLKTNTFLTCAVVHRSEEGPPIKKEKKREKKERAKAHEGTVQTTTMPDVYLPVCERRLFVLEKLKQIHASHIKLPVFIFVWAFVGFLLVSSLWGSIG